MHRNRNVEFDIILRTYQMHTLCELHEKRREPRWKKKTKTKQLLDIKGKHALDKLESQTRRMDRAGDQNITRRQGYFL